MAFKRTAIPFFELANAAYVSASVTFFQVDTATNLRLTTLITLYSSKTGTGTFSNPLTLDTDGKFTAPTYAEERFIAVVTNVDGQQHETGIWEPALSDADVLAAAASATAAAASQGLAAADATTAQVAAVSAAASAVAAAAAVGTVYSSATDVSLGRLDAKLAGAGINTLTFAAGVGTYTVPVASNTEALAKAIATKALVPSNLAALNADQVTTGFVRFATAAEVTTGTVSTAAVTPLGLGNTLTKVALWDSATFTTVSSGADVTMASNTRYRFTATVAASVSLPTTVAASSVYIVEFGCTTGATMTVKQNGNTVDGVTTNDTYNGYGPIVEYSGTGANTVKARMIGSIAR